MYLHRRYIQRIKLLFLFFLNIQWKVNLFITDFKKPYANDISLYTWLTLLNLFKSIILDEEIQYSVYENKVTAYINACEFTTTFIKVSKN